MENIEPLINRQALKAVMKGQGVSYSQAAGILGITPTGFAFKISGRKGRGYSPFTESEVQILRGLFGDSILNPAPQYEVKRKRVTL